MWLIVGLGNPGRKYAKTRHNIGFMVVEDIAERYNITFVRSKDGYKIGRGSIEGHQVFLLEPLLYMNRSGPVVHAVSRKHAIQTEHIIAVHDDLDMACGKLRIRKTGSSGGHRGIESIMVTMGSRHFVRVKIGIGRDSGMPPEDYVLSTFKRSEIVTMKDAIRRAADAVCSIVTEGIDRAMNTYNA